MVTNPNIRRPKIALWPIKKEDCHLIRYSHKQTALQHAVVKDLLPELSISNDSVAYYAVLVDYYIHK